jgi:hypothetical protein
VSSAGLGFEPTVPAHATLLRQLALQGIGIAPHREGSGVANRREINEDSVSHTIFRTKGSGFRAKKTTCPHRSRRQRGPARLSDLRMVIGGFTETIADAAITENNPSR